jgi:hypothetical protein
MVLVDSVGASSKVLARIGGAVVDVEVTVGSGPAYAADAAVSVNEIGAVAVRRTWHRSAFIDIDLAVLAIPTIGTIAQVLTRGNETVAGRRLEADAAVLAQLRATCTFVDVHLAVVAAETGGAGAVKVTSGHARVGC